MPVDANGEQFEQELQRLRSRSEERERRLWELEAEVPSVMSRWALLRTMATDLRPRFPKRSRP